MNVRRHIPPGKKAPILAAAIGAVLLLAIIVALLPVRSSLRAAYNRLRVLLASGEAAESAEFDNILFIHHSTGANLIRQGNVRAHFTTMGYSFWDHDYNYIGLTQPDGSQVGYSYNIPGDNTDPDGFAALFTQPVHDRPINAFSSIMQHDVILFKSCFPTSNITSADQLETYKSYYLEIRAVVDEHPDHLFIAFTPPPLAPESTTPEAAARARTFAEWLNSAEYQEGHPNLRVFDFFDLLAEENPDAPDYNMLRAAYRPGGGDSHPNELANQTVGPALVTFVSEAINTYQLLRG